LSALSDALAALKNIYLLEERVTSQARKVERLADQVAEMERRLARMEGQMQGFLAGATALVKIAGHGDLARGSGSDS
jgi:phage shock protein A